MRPQVFAKVVEKLRGMSPAWEDFQKGVGEVLNPDHVRSGGLAAQVSPLFAGAFVFHCPWK